MSKEPRTSEEIEAAAAKWIANIVEWKRRYIESLKNEVLDLRDKLSRLHTKFRERERLPGEVKVLRQLVEHQDALIRAYQDRRAPSDRTFLGIRRCREILKSEYPTAS